MLLFDIFKKEKNKKKKSQQEINQELSEKNKALQGNLNEQQELLTLVQENRRLQEENDVLEGQIRQITREIHDLIYPKNNYSIEVETP